MIKYFASAAIAALVAFAAHTPAFASEHRIPANSTRSISFYACPDFYLAARGDRDTDLDFDLYDPAGRLVHRDYDETDRTFKNVSNGSCGTYRLRVQNLGDVYNMMDLSIQ